VLAVSADVPMDTTYCSIIEADEAPLVVDDAARDDRVRSHPARELFAAYCGVPLRDPAGRAFGTLCHFDPRPRIGSADQLDALHRVAPIVAAYVLSGPR
jgi:GAF domain-containing protein